jgi:hypothetical protein
MDSRILHTAFTRALTSVVWDRHGENEYIMVGDGKAFDHAKIQELVNGTFQSTVLWLSRGRHDAESIERTSAAEAIVRSLPEHGPITVSDENVRHFLQVDRMGIARTGVAQSNYAFKRTAGRIHRVS